MPKALFLTLVLACVCFFDLNAQKTTDVSISIQLKGEKLPEKLELKPYKRNAKAIAEGIPDADGSLTLEFKLKHAGFFRLMADASNYLALIIEPGDNIEISASGDAMGESPVIKGSEHSLLIYECAENLKPYNSELQKLSSAMQGLGKDDPEYEQLNEEILILAEKRSDYLRSFIKENDESLACLFYSNLLDLKGNIELYDRLLNKLQKKYPENAYVRELYYAVTNEKYLAIGAKAPEIKLKNPDGKEKSLSSLKGKYVLIDFWASWCGPCRKEIPHIADLYYKYYDAGFDIYGVSLDTHKSQWLKAIQDYNMQWTQVSDLKKWQSPVAMSYAVRAIPYALLIDPKGRIIAKNIRASELKQKLQEIFGY